MRYGKTWGPPHHRDESARQMGCRCDQGCSWSKMDPSETESWEMKMYRACFALCLAFSGSAYGFGGSYDLNTDIRDAGRMALSQDALRQHRQENGRYGTAGDSAVAGNYVCKSMRGGPCDTQTELRLQSNGNWGWGGSSGQYRVRNGRVEFMSGSLASWGAAVIGADTLTFDGNVVWQKPSSGSASLASGDYYCRTAPGGCQTADPIRIDSNGTWSWGAQGGRFSILGNRIRFNGTTWGPGGWGLAAIGKGSITFSGPSTWSISGNQASRVRQPDAAPNQNYAVPSQGWKPPVVGPGFVEPGSAR